MYLKSVMESYPLSNVIIFDKFKVTDVSVIQFSPHGQLLSV